MGNFNQRQSEARFSDHLNALSEAYIQHCMRTNSLHKKEIAEKLCAHPTPGEVLDYLYSQGSTHASFADDLKKSRTPWYKFMLNAFFVASSFPISIPILIGWSLMTRGTPNFMKTDGEVYLEKVSALCAKFISKEGKEQPMPVPNSSLTDLGSEQEAEWEKSNRPYTYRNWREEPGTPSQQKQDLLTPRNVM